MIPIALTIAGSDPSGGAGLQADLKTFHQFGVYGEAVVTLITVQNTLGVTAVHTLEPELVMAQFEAVMADIPPAAFKTGALGSQELIRLLARDWGRPWILDPVLFSKNGTRLSQADLTPMLPFCTLVTPNLPEAEALTGCRGMHEAARVLERMGAPNVLIKGGHSAEDSPATDLLLYRGEFSDFPAPRVNTRHTHGTGCTLSAALTALIAMGMEIPAAVARAKAYITEAIRTNPGLGRGQGPVNHWA